MSDFLVAHFHTQLDAVTSAKQLLAFGVQRERVTLRVEGHKTLENKPDATSGSSREVSGHADLAGSITPSVTLIDSMLINEMCAALKGTVAYLIDVMEHERYPGISRPIAQVVSRTRGFSFRSFTQHARLLLTRALSPCAQA